MSRFLILLPLLLSLGLLACGGSVPPPTGDALQAPFTLMDGREAKLADFEGEVLLLVNVASKCGFTPQYEGLQALHERYASRGLRVIGFPANNFMNQEPGSNEEIQNFCSVEYGVDFLVAQKISVKGDDAHPLYRHLVSGMGNPDLAGDISWNFNKFLIARDGRLLDRFGSRTAPEDPELVSAIEEALAGP